MRAVVVKRLYGLLFLAVLAGLVWLTVLLYTKAFTPVVTVTLQAGKAGNQLSAPADVKLRGLIVGEVREITTTGDGAQMRLALDPDRVDLIPANVQARLLPKTLFGEKFVSLVLPPEPSAEPIAEGDVIAQDRTENARETEEAINDLLPLLQALEPQDVSVTLNALSTALRGRGDQLGENLVLVDDYLKQFNPQIPTLGRDLAGLADFADTLDAAAPDVLALLDDLSAISQDLVDQEQELNGFLAATTGFAQETDSFLRENETRLVRLALDSTPALRLYAKHAPMFPCLAAGLVESDRFLSEAFGGNQPGLHITLEFTEDQGGYQPGRDQTQYLDRRGPNCYGMPSPEGQAADINFQDGYRDELGPDTTQSPEEPSPAASGANVDPATALASPQAQREAMGSVLGPVMGVSPREVPDLAYLLFGPMARGTQVGLS